MYIEQDVTFGKTQSWSYVEFQHVPKQPYVTTGPSTVPRPPQESEEGAQDYEPQQDSGPQL